MRILIASLLVVSFMLVDAQSKVKPEGSKIDDYSLSRFLTELAIAAGKKDAKFIEKSLDKDVMASFGDDSGIEAFKRNYDLSKDGEFWDLLERLLVLGGPAYNGSGSYSIPYTFTKFDEVDYDAFEYSVITGSNVNVRNQPNIKTSKVVGQFSYNVVSIDHQKSYQNRDQHQKLGGDGGREIYWFYVCSPDEELCGYVYWKFVVSPIGYRMGFEKDDRGNWKITFLVAGD